jgi:hypothetical protein
LYLDQTGQVVPRKSAVEGRKWFVEDFDLFSAFRSWREGSLSLKDWLRSFAGVEEAACFAFDDPLPLLMMGVADCCELFQWARGQVAARLRPSGSCAPGPEKEYQSCANQHISGPEDSHSTV